MESVLSDALRESACETLENLAFTELVPDPAGNLPGAGESVCARIGLGPDGRMELILSRPLLAEIAGILFSLEDEPDAGILSDTLLELANIIAGRFLEKRYHGGSDFTMGLPEARPDSGGWDSLTLRMVLSAGPGRLLALGLNGEPP